MLSGEGWTQTAFLQGASAPAGTGEFPYPPFPAGRLRLAMVRAEASVTGQAPQLVHSWSLWTPGQRPGRIPAPQQFATEHVLPAPGREGLFLVLSPRLALLQMGIKGPYVPVCDRLPSQPLGRAGTPRASTALWRGHWQRYLWLWLSYSVLFKRSGH